MLISTIETNVHFKRLKCIVFFYHLPAIHWYMESKTYSICIIPPFTPISCVAFFFSPSINKVIFQSPVTQKSFLEVFSSIFRHLI